MLDSDFDKEQDNSPSDDDDNDIQTLSSESNDETQAPRQIGDAHDCSIRVILIFYASFVLAGLIIYI